MQRYLYSERDMRRETVDAMRRADSRRELIYAYNKTGLMVTEDNRHLLTPNELAEWNAAIDEYFDLLENDLEEHPFVVATRELVNEIDACIMSFGYALEFGLSKNKRPRLSSSKLLTLDEYIILLSARCFHLVRGVNFLLAKEDGLSALPLIRGIYESYLNLIYSDRFPDKLAHMVDAQAGLRTGTHEYKSTKAGKIDRRKIVDLNSGVEYEAHISFFVKALASHHKVDIELFDMLYEFLSDFTHGGWESMTAFIDEDRIHLTEADEGASFQAVFLAIVCSILVLDFLSSWTFLSSKVRSDLKRVVKRIKKKIVMHARKFLDPKGEDILISTVVRRLELL